MQLGPTQDVALFHHRGIYLPPHPRPIYCSFITTNYYCPPVSEDFFFPKQKREIRGARDKLPTKLNAKLARTSNKRGVFIKGRILLAGGEQN